MKFGRSRISHYAHRNAHAGCAGAGLLHQRLDLADIVDDLIEGSADSDAFIGRARSVQGNVDREFLEAGKTLSNLIGENGCVG
jgi:hypothetical protein